MKTIFPHKLQTGDVVAVLALSGVRSVGDTAGIKQATKYLERLNFDVVFGNLKRGSLKLNVADVETRIRDIDNAIKNDARAIIIYAGGDNINQILPRVDFKALKAHAPIICGFSDNTSLLNAVYNTTGLVTYYGPNFRSFAGNKEQKFIRESFESMVIGNGPVELKNNTKWWYDKVYLKKNKVYNQHRNSGWWTFNKAIGQGTLIGGEISTMLTLHGTPWAPKYKNKVLFLEMYKGSLGEFDRMLEAILQQKGADRLEGLLIGRFQGIADIKRKDLRSLLLAKPQLRGVPIVANLDFGHTLPMLTLPVGGEATVRVGSKPHITINEH